MHFVPCAVWDVGARFVPRNRTPILTATRAIRLICFIILNYFVLLYKSPMTNCACGICHLLYIKPKIFGEENV
jgi:hypothetical protein